MKAFEYIHACEQLKQYEEDLEKVICYHQSDSDLCHPIGKDKNCWYCEQYTKIILQEEDMIQSVRQFEHENEITVPFICNILQTTKCKSKSKARKSYEVHAVTLSTGEEFLVYGLCLEVCCRAMEIKEDDVTKDVIIPKSYYGSTYLELKNSAIISLETLLKSFTRKRTRILAEKRQTKIRITGTCFNEIPFYFFKYTADNFNRLGDFCDDVPIIQTKKFHKNGKVVLSTKRGMLALAPGQILLKIGLDVFLTMSTQEFEENFVEDESLVWSRVNLT